MYLANYFDLPTVAAQQALLSTLAPLQRTMLQECWETSYGDYTAWTQEPSNTAYVNLLASKLATEAKLAGYDYFHEAEFILNFVQTALPYQPTASYQQLPAMTLFDNGQCDNKAVLYASILEALGYKVALLGLPFPSGPYTGHEAVGVAFTAQQMTQTSFSPFPYLQNGQNYYFAETTTQGWLLGAKSYAQIPLIYPLN